MRALWSSDQHTLHQITPTYHTLGNLSKFLCKDHALAKTDMVFFGGDFFECLVESPNAGMFQVADWGKEFLHDAYEANKEMIVIFLEGTSSHDWKQPKHFLNWAPKGLDIRYIDTLKIEVYEKHDNLSVMYVPDNMGKMTPDEIWDAALKVLKASNMDMVDMICFHGAFEFQLHTNARHKAHILERWESIVRYGIFAGHIHTPVQKGKLYTSGSFDRTRHGEEHPKGGYLIELDKKKDLFTPTFWENKNALPYLTISVNQEIQSVDLIKQVHAFIRSRKLPPSSQIRIQGGSSEVVDPVVKILSADYPNIGFKADNETTKDILMDEELFDSETYEGVSLTKDNLQDSLFPDIKDRLFELNISADEAASVLKEFL